MSKLSCSRARYWLQLYVDERLDVRRLPTLEAHLDTCSACRRELASLEEIRGALAATNLEREPENLTGQIMVRVAAVEARRARARAAARPFSVRWGDAVLAALLASVATLSFILLDPTLRATIPAAFMRSFPSVAALLMAPGPGSIAWIAWIVWVATGVGIALWFAGAEARSTWRRSLSERVPRQLLTQLREM